MYIQEIHLHNLLAEQIAHIIMHNHATIYVYVMICCNLFRITLSCHVIKSCHLVLSCQIYFTLVPKPAALNHGYRRWTCFAGAPTERRFMFLV